MKIWKFTLLVLALPLSLPSFAEEENFSQHKTQVLQELDQRISELQKARDCLNTAQDHQAAKVCRESHRAWREKEHGEHKEMRQQWKKERMQRRGERKGSPANATQSE